ncbi:hypothetical protein IJS77_02605 [bacterium]|nr:hypothetical protein [bacterium]
MKRIVSSLVLAFYLIFLFTATGLASELYFIKNGSKSAILPVIQNSFNTSGYTIKNSDPVYGVKGSDGTVAILEQSGSDAYYFIDSTVDSDLSKKIKSAIKAIGYNCKKVRNDTMSMSYSQTALALKKSLSSETKTYNFDRTQNTQTNINAGNYTTTNNYTNSVPQNQSQDPNGDNDVWTGYIAQIPAGTTFNVYLQSAINTATAMKGDEVVGVLTKNWTYRGYVIAEQGSKVIGYISKANSAGMAQRDGKVKFSFNQLQTTDGKVYAISTEEIEFKVDSEGKVASNVGKVVGGAAVGALVGLLFGALDGRDGAIGRGAAWGAGVGAAWGTGSAVMEHGSDAEIPIYTEMSIKLTAPLKMVLSN